MHGLSEKGIIHRDIKPENILLNDDKVAFVADVGDARIYDQISLARKPKTTRNIVGTEDFMSPEVKWAFDNEIKIKTDMTKVDVFSLGLIALFVLDYKNFIKYKNKLNKLDCESELNKYLEDIDKRSDLNLSKQIRQIPDRVFLIYLKSMLSFPSSKLLNMENSTVQFNIPTRPSIIDVFKDLVEVLLLILI